MHDENYLDELVRNSAGPKYSSFNDLYLHLYPLLIRYVKKFLWYNNGYAEDVISEAFLKVIERIEQFKPGTNITNWIYRISRNSALDFREKKKRQHHSEEFKPGANYSSWIYQSKLAVLTLREKEKIKHLVDFLSVEDIPSRSQSPENEVIGNLYIDSLFAHLQENVKPLFLEPVKMLYEDFKYEEISEELEIPMGTAQSRIARGLKQSRLHLDDFIDIDERYL